VQEEIAAIRPATDKPFGVNFLLFLIQEAALTAALESRPPVVSFAWARPDQDLRPYAQRVHDAGSLVMHMAGEVPEAVRAAKAGVDVIVAQGTEGGGHVGWMATMALVPMVVQAVAPIPVLAAGAAHTRSTHTSNESGAADPEINRAATTCLCANDRCRRVGLIGCLRLRRLPGYLRPRRNLPPSSRHVRLESACQRRRPRAACPERLFAR